MTVDNTHAVKTVSAEALSASRDFSRDLTRRAARNFYYGLKLLPEPKRSAMYALYAYMRLVDDIADDERPREQRAVDLDRWEALTHQAIAAAHDEAAMPDGHTLWPAFAEMVRQYRVPTKVFDDMIAGQRQDLEPVTIPDFAALRAYCYRVASVVGVASLYVFGFSGGDETIELSVERGIAFQLTNILRDLREDAARGRCYLPADEMTRFGVSTAEIAAGTMTAGMNTLLQHQIERAREFYAHSEKLHALVQPDARPTLWAMTEIYRGILEKIAAKPERAMRRRIGLSSWAKIRIAWSAMRSRGVA
jgi:phytoene synthase